MNRFNMNEPNVKPSEEIHAAAHEMGRDEAGRLYSVRMRELMKPLGVDITAVEALAALRIAGKTLRMMQERWAEKLDSTPRNITGLVDHLERDGLVERVPDPQDRRSVRARLTPAGRERIESIWKEGLEHQFEMVQEMTKDDLAQLRHLCLQLVENARKELGK